MILHLLLSCSLLATPGALEKVKGKVVPLAYGITRIDMTGQNAEGMAVLANRENFNAHGFDVLTLYVRTLPPWGGAKIWSLVSVFDGEKEKLVTTVSGGADCLLHDFRLVAQSGGRPIALVVADRELGASYADPANVTFSFYELRNNRDGEVGRPVYYFERTSQVKARRPYCDVGEAFWGELGLANWRPAGAPAL